MQARVLRPPVTARIDPSSAWRSISTRLRSTICSPRSQAISCRIRQVQRFSQDPDTTSAAEAAFDHQHFEEEPEQQHSEHLEEEGDGVRNVFFKQQQEMATMLVEDELEDSSNPHPVKDILDTAKNAHSEEKSVKGAKIHDFCLGIPYGALLVATGAALFIITGSKSAVQLGLFLGGLLLALSMASFNAWKKGKSSMSYIQGQAAITFAILFIELQKAYQTRGLLPSTVALLSGAMFGFYCYVFVSGGNPPKKLKHAGT